ncbi:topoisomerase [Streptomyces griseocarneus]|nr:topoisomerase [Streptomyces griseocarneus]
MWRLSESQKHDLVTAAIRYSSSYQGSPAEALMVDRGLGAVAERLGVGFVSEPAISHERYRGHLAIPYLRPAGGINSVATIRFRRLGDGGGPKYLGLPGHPPRIFNTQALINPSPYVAVCEGELDAMAAEAAGVPAVGIPGVSSWRDHFDPAFAGYETVFVLGDGDDAGRKFSQAMSERLPNAKGVDLGDGYDVNKFVQEFGHDAFKERLGL